MGIIDRIKQTASNVVSNVVRRKPKVPEQKVVQYTTVEQDGNTTKTTISNQPPKKKFSEQINRANEDHKRVAEQTMGEGLNVDHHNRPEGQQTVSKFRAMFGGSGANRPAPGARTESIGSRVAEWAQRRNAENKPKYAATIQKTKQALITKAKETRAYVAKVQKAQKTTARQDIAMPGNVVIQAFTGVNPQKRYAQIQKKRAKISMGNKISKKEAKLLQKKYGNNWQAVIKRNSTGYYANPTQSEVMAIKRQNRMESSSVNFGSAFPSPSFFISSQESRQPFTPRSIDPFDVEANFMGSIASTKKRDPFAIKGIKL